MKKVSASYILILEEYSFENNIEIYVYNRRLYQALVGL